MSLSHRHVSGSSRRQRLLALPLVLLCALAYLGSAAHFVLVRHSTCAAHGEWVEGGAEGGDEIAPAQGPVSSAEERIASASGLPSGHHSGDLHCPHSLLRRGIVLPSAGQWKAYVPEVAGRVRWTDTVRQEPQIAWLHLAPKASPPRA